MVKLKELLNEGDLKEVKYQIKHLNEYLKSHEEALKKYKKWFKLISKKPKNISVRDAESLMEKHKDLLSSQFNKETYFMIENLIEEVKELEND